MSEIERKAAEYRHLSFSIQVGVERRERQHQHNVGRSNRDCYYLIPVHQALPRVHPELRMRLAL
jgi:hypothetical protein